MRKKWFGRMVRLRGSFFWMLLVVVGLQVGSTYGQNYVVKKTRVFNPVEFVNPLIGTKGAGGTVPGVIAPFGMVQLTPNTQQSLLDSAWGYRYADTLICGFSQMPIVGGRSGGDFLMMPSSSAGNSMDGGFSAAFSHLNETASPGYYSVLMKNDVLAEITATAHCGMYCYSFPYGALERLLVDYADGEASFEQVGENEIRGVCFDSNQGEVQPLYFVIRFSKPIEKRVVYAGGILQKSRKSYTAKGLKAVFDFPAKDKKSLLVKIGVSRVDTTGARLNLDVEMPGWIFDAYRMEARAMWNHELRKIEVESSNKNQMSLFYTAFYHTLQSPNIQNDVDGRYRGVDGKLHKPMMGSNYYALAVPVGRCQGALSLHLLLNPLRSRDLLRSLLAQSEQGAVDSTRNRTWSLYHAAPLFLEAFVGGMKEFEVKKAYQAMKVGAMRPENGLSNMHALGFVASDLEEQSVSKTLRYATNDWAVAQFADMFGEDSVKRSFTRFARGYKLLYDSVAGFIRPRNRQGWVTPFTPDEVGGCYPQVSARQYAFEVPHDVSGLIELRGGAVSFEKHLDELFSRGDGVGVLPAQGISGVLGRYSHSSPSSRFLPYLYGFVGRPAKTAERVRQLMSENYRSTPDGLCADDAGGDLSAWLVMSALGVYPVNPGSNLFVIGSPMFTKSTLRLPNGKIFVVSAPNNSASNIYVNSAVFNGQPYSKSFFTTPQITNGGVLELEMGNRPSESFGTRREDIPVIQILESYR